MILLYTCSHCGLYSKNVTTVALALALACCISYDPRGVIHSYKGTLPFEAHLHYRNNIKSTGHRSSIILFIVLKLLIFSFWKEEFTLSEIHPPMRLCHPPDGSTSPKYKLLCFIRTKNIWKEKNALAFNWDRCCHLVLCLWLIPFHFLQLNGSIC